MSAAEVGLRWLVVRLLGAAGVILAVACLVSALAILDPVDRCTPLNTGDLSTEQLASLRALYGCDLTPPARFGRSVAQALTLDFGTSPYLRVDVRSAVLESLPATLALTVPALILGVLAGFGLATASLGDGVPARVLRLLGAAAWGVPPALLALVTMAVAARGGWPATCGFFDGVWPVERKEAILPIATLAVPLAAGHARFFREILRVELGKPYVLALRARGLDDGVIWRRHVLRNALGPIVALLGLDLPWLFGGAVVVEQLYRWHGVGSLLATAVLSRDTPVVTSCAMVITAAVVVGGTLSRVAHAAVDPRVRL